MLTSIKHLSNHQICTENLVSYFSLFTPKISKTVGFATSFLPNFSLSIYEIGNSKQTKQAKNSTKESWSLEMVSPYLDFALLEIELQMYHYY